MKAKKIAKRLRKLSAEFHVRARTWEGDNAEHARLVTIADMCELLANDVFAFSTTPKKTKRTKRRDPIMPVMGKDGSPWVKGQDFPTGKDAD